MSDEQLRPDVRRLWQSQADEDTSLSLEDLRNRASKMDSIILARTFVSGLAFSIFIVLLLFAVRTHVRVADMRVTQYLFLIGAGFSLWQFISLLRRARGRALPEREPQACATFYRSELERQRNSHRRSAVWVPLAFSAAWIWGLLATPHLRVVMIVIWVLFVPFWVHSNWEAGRRSQRELDELNASFR